MAQKLFFSETEAIRQKGANNERIIDTLKTIASNNPSAYARKEANKRLTYLGITPPPTRSALKESNRWLFIGLFARLFSVLIYPALNVLTLLGGLLFGSSGILLAVGGAYLGRKNTVTALIGGVAGAILWFFVLIFSCTICQ